MPTPQIDPARKRVIAYNAKHIADHEATFRALTSAGALAVRVAAPLFSPVGAQSGEPAMMLTGCTCGRTLCALHGCSDPGHCHTPGKHPLGEGWQNYGTTDWDTASGWLGQGLNLGYLAQEQVIGIDFDDVSKIATIFPNGIPTDTLTDEVEGRPHVWLRVQPHVDVKDTIPALFDGGEVARAGSRMLVAPVALHAHGARRRWNGVETVAVAGDDVIARLVAAKRHNKERQQAKAGDEGYKVTAGGRHAFMDSQAGQLRNVISGEDALLAALIAVNEERCEPPIERSYLERLAHDFVVNKEGLPPPVTITIRSEEVVIDPLVVADFSTQPPPDLDRNLLDLPTGLDALMQHYEQVCDAGWAGLALTTLVELGVLYGPRPALDWKGMNHTSLFGVLVGRSGIGRKSVTMKVVRQTLGAIDSELPAVRHGGFGSGEVMIDTLADSTRRVGLPAMLIEEQELSSMLIVSERQGTTLSGTMRQMYDGEAVSAKSRKTGAVSAHGYHVGLVAGITPEELSKRLSADALTNGWANRMIWFWTEKRDDDRLGRYASRNSSMVIDPGIGKYVAASIDFARQLPGVTLMGTPVAGGATMTLSDEAFDFLENLHTALDVRQVGLAGMVRARMLPNIVRMAMVSALLDQTSVVTIEYVRFAKAMADYAVASVRSVFGERVDDPVAMYVISLLSQAPGGWLNTTDLRTATGKDYSRIQSALRILLAAGLIVSEKRSGMGRPALGFRLVGL